MPLRKLLVPVDGSEVSRKAITLAGRIASGYRYSVMLLYVLESPPMPSFTFPDDVREREMKAMEDEGRKLLEELEQTLKDAGVDVSSKVVVGSAPEAILMEVEAGRYSMIVIGSTGLGRGRLSNMLLGSVAERVIRGAKVPVLLIKEDTVLD